MALNRAWYDALVDDDGSNTVGTVWGKDDIKNLLDSVDAELARLDGGWLNFTPALYADAGVWSSASALMQYRTQAGGIEMQVSIEASTLSSATGAVHIQLPVMAAVWAGTHANPVTIFLGGAYEVGAGTIPPARNVLTVVRSGGQQIPAGGGFYVRGQITYKI
jgi:hypothetical protein